MPAISIKALCGLVQLLSLNSGKKTSYLFPVFFSFLLILNLISNSFPKKVDNLCSFLVLFLHTN